MSDAIEKIKMKIIEASAELIEATVTDTIIPLDVALAVIDEELAKEPQECNSGLISKLAEDFYYIENGKIHPYTGNYGETDYDESVDLIECINNQPQVQQWIPCSERLPEELVPVNITWINRNPESYYAEIKDVPFTATGVYFDGKWYWHSCTCIDMLKEYGRSDFDIVDVNIYISAWQPLPSVWKGENNG